MGILAVKLLLSDTQHSSRCPETYGSSFTTKPCVCAKVNDVSKWMLWKCRGNWWLCSLSLSPFSSALFLTYKNVCSLSFSPWHGLLVTASFFIHNIEDVFRITQISAPRQFLLYYSWRQLETDCSVGVLGFSFVVVILIVLNLFKEKPYILLCEWSCIAILPVCMGWYKLERKHPFLPWKPGTAQWCLLVGFMLYW